MSPRPTGSGACGEDVDLTRVANFCRRRRRPRVGADGPVPDAARGGHGDGAPLPDSDLPYVRPSDEQHTLHDWSVVRERLESEITAEAPRSLASVLRELGLDTRQAKRTCARECAAIAERHRLWAVERVRTRREEKAALVRAAIAETIDGGDYPSRHQVQGCLPSSVSLREAALHAIWTDEAREPGRTFLKV